jgi:PKD repeat protein
MSQLPEAMRRSTCLLVLALLAALSAAAPASAKQRIEQLAEDGAQTRTLDAPGALARPTSHLCESGARWMRLRFDELRLGSYDSLVITSNGGDRTVFEGDRWRDRSFSTRALRGSCVDIAPYFASDDSRFRVGSYQFGMQPLADTSVTVAGAGDICDSTGTKCGGTSDLIVAINPTTVFTAGDNAYTNGTLTEYNNTYAPTWGRFKALTSPTPGNHDYNTSGASGYFDYFNGVGAQTGPAGDRSKGYYSYDVGDWHMVALNTMSGGTVATAQLDWLTADLAATTKPCIAAYFHHPLVSRGNYTGYAQVKPFWDRLYAAHADLVLVGHDHNYQRYAKMNPNQAAAADGIRQVLVGTGGRAFYPLSGTHALLQASNDNTHGVLKLTLTATGYTGEFVPSDGTFTDTFSGTCNDATPPVNTPPVANYTFTTSGLAATFTDASTDSDGTLATRAWNFGDGGTATIANPSHTYASAGTYNVALTVTDNGGATHTVTKAVTVTTSGNVLGNGVAKTGLAAATGAYLKFTMVVPAGATGLKFVQAGGTGDSDLYVRFGSEPTDSVYDCRPYANGNAETCNIATVQAGTYYINLKAYAAFSGVSLTGSYTPPGSNVAPVANFAFTTSGLVASFTDTSTDSDGTIASRAWNFGDGGTATTANPSHTYAAAGTYTVAETVTDNGGLTNTKSVSVTVTNVSCGGTVLCNGVAVALPSQATNTTSPNYTMVVPAGKTSVVFTISGGTGDADLYVKLGSAPTTSSYTCRPYTSGNAETCTLNAPAAGTYYINVRAYAAFSGVSLKGTISP